MSSRKKCDKQEQVHPADIKGLDYYPRGLAPWRQRTTIVHKQSALITPTDTTIDQLDNLTSICRNALSSSSSSAAGVARGSANHTLYH